MRIFSFSNKAIDTSGIVPWEFSVGTRSPVLPFLLGLIFAAAEPLVGGPEVYIFVARLLLALSSLAGVVAVYRMGRRISPTHAVLGGLVTRLGLSLCTSRGGTEAVATTVLLVGLSLERPVDRELAKEAWGRLGTAYYKLRATRWEPWRRDTVGGERVRQPGRGEMASPREVLLGVSNGDVSAINSLADRTDGKVAQALIGDSEEDSVRLVHTITRRIVEPDAK